MPNSWGTPFVFSLESKGLLKQNGPCNFSKLGIKTISCFKLLLSIGFFFLQNCCSDPNKIECLPGEAMGSKIGIYSKNYISD